VKIGGTQHDYTVTGIRRSVDGAAG
jgi:hypothetical protein